MQELSWLGSHIGSIEDAIQEVNQFKWEIKVTEHNGQWFVTTGEIEKHVIYASSNREGVDAFLYGLSLAYIGIPDPLHTDLITDLADWYSRL